jgi:uncharacterized protein (TIGR03435 family)
MLSIAAFAQQATGPLKFEVASIRRSEPEAKTGSFGVIPGGGYRAINYPLQSVLGYAFHRDISRLSIKSAWVLSERYAIEAKAADGAANEDQIRSMLVQLLVERCHLKFHRESPETLVYMLSIDKKGAKLKDSTEARVGPIGIGLGSVDAKNAPMTLLTTALTRMLGRIVVDETGLTGKYDFALHFDQSSVGIQFQPRDNAADSGIGEPSIFTAIQEQLGLHLESTKRPIEMVVIDSIDRPTEN